eukprot:CAMPEP_0172162716 /NCGR_PEP_ID=MMETSP1050-20130122/6837_1 /TAXON_ID=233186 /ORGANISM="Cryptomonas curvata, Strain CCAP979/52" /LENGTH=123 /DNA_ID=CAMNT_0012832759 /DNA_START=41 /DNA_END=412 /DNA_ORIENTATION=-
MPATYAQMTISSIGRKSPMEKRPRSSPRREVDRLQQTWDTADFPVLQATTCDVSPTVGSRHRVEDRTADIDGYLKETMQKFVIPDEASAARRAAAILSHLRRIPIAPGGNLFGTFWDSSPSRI